MMTIWFIAFLIFIVAEIATVNLVTVWFALGSLVALLAAAYSLSLVWQIVIFMLVSILGMILFFAVIKPKLSKGKNIFEPTNADRLVGREGVVCEKIDPKANLGRVLVEGSNWRALSEDQQPIEEGAAIKVLSLQSTKLIVKKLPEKET